MPLKMLLSLRSKGWGKWLLSWNTMLDTRFDNLSISHKLTLGLGVLVGLTFLVVGRNYLGSFMATANIKRTQELRVPTVVKSAGAETNLLKMSSHVWGYLATGESEFRNLYQQARQDFESELAQMIALLQTDSSSENKRRLQELQATYQQWKILPARLFTLRDNYFENQAAIRLLKEEGEAPIAIILLETKKMLAAQAARSPSSANTNLLKDMADFQSSFALLVSSLRGYLVTQEPSFRFEYAAKFNANQKVWKILTDNQSSLTPAQQKSLRIIAENRESFLELRHQMFAIVESKRNREDLYLFSTQAEPLAEKMFTLLQEIVTSQQSALSSELKIGNQSLISAQWQAILGGILALLVAIFMGLLLRKKIAAPIARLTEATARIMKGDLDSKAKVESGDEIGTLAATFNQMTYHLKQSLQELENYSHVLEERTIALADAKEAAVAANRAKSTFLASISHELRTPLNAILGFTQLMSRDSTTTAQQKETLEIINKSGEHLLVLIDDVLEVSKIEAGKTKLNVTDCDLHYLLNSLQDMLQLKAQHKNLEFIWEISPSVPRYVQTDESKLRQVLINLLGNAIKFTERGHVKLQVLSANSDQLLVTSEQCQICFLVEDTGIGISPQELDSLFEPFVQAEAGTQSQQGTGLGLAISRNFVQLMGGDISVVSQPSQGSTFRFDIQVKQVDDVRLAIQTSRHVIGLAPGQPRYRILIFEDRRENSLLLLNLLKPLGFEVQLSENGQEGIALWKSWKPHLILMDIQMPVMDGLEVTKYIRANSIGQKTIIIALTASAFEGRRINCLAAGCDDFLSKPFQKYVLLEKIAQHLGVRYLYEKSQVLPLSSLAVSENPQAKIENLKLQIAQMPAEWVAQLNHFACAADTEQILLLLEKIPQESSYLVQAIANLLDNFDFEQIINLT